MSQRGMEICRSRRLELRSSTSKLSRRVPFGRHPEFDKQLCASFNYRIAKSSRLGELYDVALYDHRTALNRIDLGGRLRETNAFILVRRFSSWAEREVR
jgi:hypothetical protein